MYSGQCGSRVRDCTRVPERNTAAVQRYSAGRREPPACLRATAARAALRPPRPRHAPPAPAPRTRHADTARHTPHAARPILTPHASHCHCRAPIAPAAGSRTARISMCSLSGDVSGLRGGGTHRGAGGWSCALRHASVSPVSCVLPQPSICRDGPRRPSRSPAEPWRLTRCYDAVARPCCNVMPCQSVFSQCLRELNYSHLSNSLFICTNHYSAVIKFRVKIISMV